MTCQRLMEGSCDRANDGRVAQSHTTLLYVITLISSVIVWTDRSFKSSERQERSSGGRNSEHMSHHGGPDSVLTPFGAHTCVVEDKSRKLRLQMMSGPFGGAAGTGFLREECWMDGWRSGAKDGWMDRTSGQETLCHVVFAGRDSGSEPVRGTGLKHRTSQ